MLWGQFDPLKLGDVSILDQQSLRAKPRIKRTGMCFFEADFRPPSGRSRAEALIADTAVESAFECRHARGAK